MAINTGVFWHALETITTFFLIGYLGFYLAKKGWFSDESSNLLSRLLTRVVIPLNLVYSIRTALTKEEFLANIGSALMPFLSIVLSLGIAWLLARWAKVERRHRSIFITAFSCSNTINIGLPINLALFGEVSLPAVLIYYMANTVLFWSVGNYLLASDSDAIAPAPLLSRQTAKRILSPAIIAFLIGVALLLLDIRIPVVLGNAAKYLGGMTTGLATMCIGISIFETGIRNIKLNREVLLICLGRFVISPLLLLGLLYWMPVQTISRNVYIIQSSLPPMTSIVLLAMYYKTDEKFASVAVSFATLCSIVTVPVFMVLLA